MANVKNMKKFNKKLVRMFFCCYMLYAICYMLTGCATAPIRETLPTFNINGTTYFPVISLCDEKNINWQYDTFTRTVILTKGSHKINLRVGDTLVLLDGSAYHLNHPIDIYQGTIIAPYRFKEKILDTLFREIYPERRTGLPLLRLKKIVIDAGHGGKDPGAIGRTGLREKDVNLDIAKRLARLLRLEGIEAVMTREGDRFVSLSRRANIANNSGADLFISIHSNANHVRSVKGFELYYVSPSINDSKRAYATAESASLNLDKALFGSNSTVLKAIVWDMIFTSNRAVSIELSRSICRAVNNNLDARILGVKGARFQVLRETHMPSILIEVGFLSNYNEERMLKNGYYRQRIAESILQGIKDYINLSG
jgi:N-acetylmuramoyl-L-alanine amidase